MSLDVPITVYHVACMNNWLDVVREQFLLLRESGLAPALAAINDTVRISHVGQHLDEILTEAARQDVPVSVIRSDGNTDHYETFAMIEIDRLAKEEQVQRPFLYFHTKGVSNPGDWRKAPWRHAMEYHVVHKWRENVDLVANQERDAAGMNWWDHGDEHFSGTFWVARADWIRQLPNFIDYHRSRGFERYSCELWIGSNKQKRCNAYSHGDMNAHMFQGNYDFRRVLPPEQPPQETITWVSAVTPPYMDDALRLQRSFRLLGPGHNLVVCCVEQRGKWRYDAKLQALRRVLPSIDTSHVVWIDADCEFACIQRVRDFLDLDKPLVAVRHFAFQEAREIIPARLQDRLPSPCPKGYWQTCLWGGTKEAVKDVLDAVRWMNDDPEGYDEHGLNIEFLHRAEQIHTLPCRYAAPSNFQAWPQFEATYHERSGGASRIYHHNRTSYLR